MSPGTISQLQAVHLPGRYAAGESALAVREGGGSGILNARVMARVVVVIVPAMGVRLRMDAVPCPWVPVSRGPERGGCGSWLRRWHRWGLLRRWHGLGR